MNAEVQQRFGRSAAVGTIEADLDTAMAYPTFPPMTEAEGRAYEREEMQAGRANEYHNGFMVGD